jgi:hypothetical protein
MNPDGGMSILAVDRLRANANFAFPRDHLSIYATALAAAVSNVANAGTTPMVNAAIAVGSQQTCLKL